MNEAELEIYLEIIIELEHERKFAREKESIVKTLCPDEEEEILKMFEKT